MPREQSLKEISEAWGQLESFLAEEQLNEARSEFYSIASACMDLLKEGEGFTGLDVATRASLEGTLNNALGVVDRIGPVRTEFTMETQHAMKLAVQFITSMRDKLSSDKGPAPKVG